MQCTRFTLIAAAFTATLCGCSKPPDPTLNCEPYGFAREIVNALPIKISKDGANLVIDYEEWSQTRTIYMDGRDHPTEITPTMMGHSIGHFYNGVLVVDTVALAPDI